MNDMIEQQLIDYEITCYQCSQAHYGDPDLADCLGCETNMIIQGLQKKLQDPD